LSELQEESHSVTLVRVLAQIEQAFGDVFESHVDSQEIVRAWVSSLAGAKYYCFRSFALLVIWASIHFANFVVALGLGHRIASRFGVACQRQLRDNALVNADRQVSAGTGRDLLGECNSLLLFGLRELAL
jgi:hypothetical protein